MTLFWHGPRDIARPRLPEWVGELFKAIPIGIEYDFDTEEAPSRRIEAA